MWSRTSTANKGPPSRIGNELAEYAALGVKNIRKPRRQIGKRNRQAPAEHPDAHRPAFPPRRPIGAHASNPPGATARHGRPGSRPAAAGGYGRRRRAEPAPGRRHTSSVRARSPRSPQATSAVARPAAVPLAWMTRSQSAGAASGLAKPTPSLRANSARAGLISTSVTCAPASCPHRKATSAPTTPAPTMAMRSAGPAPHPRPR